MHRFRSVRLRGHAKVIRRSRRVARRHKSTRSSSAERPAADGSFCRCTYNPCARQKSPAVQTALAGGVPRRCCLDKRAARLTGDFRQGSLPVAAGPRRPVAAGPLCSGGSGSHTRTNPLQTGPRYLQRILRPVFFVEQFQRQRHLPAATADGPQDVGQWSYAVTGIHAV